MQIFNKDFVGKDAHGGVKKKCMSPKLPIARSGNTFNEVDW